MSRELLLEASAAVGLQISSDGGEPTCCHTKGQHITHLFTINETTLPVLLEIALA